VGRIRRDAFLLLDRKISLFLNLPLHTFHQERNRQDWTSMTPPVLRRLASHFPGTAFLVAAVGGSGIMVIALPTER
jgi:hypothetical protein